MRRAKRAETPKARMRRCFANARAGGRAAPRAMRNPGTRTRSREVPPAEEWREPCGSATSRPAVSSSRGAGSHSPAWARRPCSSPRSIRGRDGPRDGRRMEWTRRRYRRPRSRRAPSPRGSRATKRTPESRDSGRSVARRVSDARFSWRGMRRSAELSAIRVDGVPEKASQRATMSLTAGRYRTAAPSSTTGSAPVQPLRCPG